MVSALAGHVEGGNIAATYPDKVKEVVSYLEGRGPVSGGPNISSAPEVWVLGSGSAGYLTSDLSYDYVRINADYRS